MWPFKSRRKNGSPERLPAEEITTVPELRKYVDDTLARVLEVLEAHQTDLTTINTAINRIERKQNRWLEVLNVNEGKAEVNAEEAALPAPAERLSALLQPGDETEL